MFIRLAMLCLLACVGLAHAEGMLEVIPLHNRTVEEVMPSLRPLLEPGGTLTGMQGQLILRASDANRAEIKQALAALDTIPRQLTITVRQSLDRADSRQAAELFGKIDGRNVDLTLPPAGSGGAPGSPDWPCWRSWRSWPGWCLSCCPRLVSTSASFWRAWGA